MNQQKIEKELRFLKIYAGVTVENEVREKPQMRPTHKTGLQNLATRYAFLTDRPIEIEQTAFIQMNNEIPFAFDAAGNKFPLGATLTELEKTLDPKAFFRLNRSEIVNLDFIENLKPDFHDRLVVCLRNLNIKLVSSTSRTPSLRKWLENT